MAIDVQGQKLDWKWIRDDAEQTDLLRGAGDRLADRGLALLTLDNNVVEDAFSILLLEAAGVDAVQKLALQTGYGSPALDCGNSRELDVAEL